MDFFNKLGETIANKSKEVVQSARDVKDMASLKAKIGQQESRIKNWYQVIGEKVYRAEKDQEHSALETEFSMITDAFAEIGRLKKEMEKIKGVKTCPSCKAEVDDSVKFCPECGERLMSECSSEIEDEPCESAEEDDKNWIDLSAAQSGEHDVEEEQGGENE